MIKYRLRTKGPFFLFLLLNVSTLVVLAQEISPTASKGITLRPGMQWRVEQLESNQKILWDWSGSAPVPAKEQPLAKEEKSRLKEENRIGKNFRDRTYYPDNGAPQRTIFDGQMILFFRPTDQKFTVDTQSSDAEEILNHRVMEGFDWVSEKWFSGKVEVDGVLCNVYRAPWPVPLSTDAETHLPPEIHDPVVVAAIAVKDGFPRRLENTSKVLRITPLKTLSPVPELPAQALSALEEDNKRGEEILSRYQINQ